MQMVGQHAHRDRLERVALSGGCIRPAQMIDVPDQEIARAVVERQGEEKPPSLDLRSTISRHGDDIIILFVISRPLFVGRIQY
jgi:hypothetical protein